MIVVGVVGESGSGSGVLFFRVWDGSCGGCGGGGGRYCMCFYFSLSVPLITCFKYKMCRPVSQW